MKIETNNLFFSWRRILFCVSLILNSQFSILNSQESVSPVTCWLATVDEPTQQIVLSWCPSPDNDVMGYHICAGNPCLDYDTLFGRLDTLYRCVDQSPLEPHVYRVHVFDSAYNVSALTPAFGNIVLTADVPQCATEVNVSWTPYTGMPSGVALYYLMAKLEPRDDDYKLLFAPDSATLSYRFDISEGVTRVWLKVQALSRPLPGSEFAILTSQSNVVSVERRTVDTAAFFEISSVEYDSISIRNILTLNVDTSYHASPWYLWRSIDGSPWRIIDSISPSTAFTYIDSDVNPYDSLYLYRLSVFDACGMNERYSASAWVVIPDPLPPAIAIPNTIIVGDPVNGLFRPVVQGLKGDLYELYIYNRNGILVYSTTDPAAGWAPAANTPQGAYVYTLTCRFNNNRVKTYTGSVLVLK